MKPKFSLGDKVKFFKHDDNQVGEVISFGYDSTIKEFRYTITAKAYDPIKNEMIEGTQTCLESELVAEGVDAVKDEVVKEKENE